MNTSADWLRSGTGRAPRIAWAFTTDAELAGMVACRETGDLFAADRSGGLYRLNRTGRVESLSRGLADVRLIRWSDRAEVGVVVCGDSDVCVLDERMHVAWSTETPSPVTGMGIDAWGHNLALSLHSGDTVLLSVDRQKLGQFSTSRPLKFIEFSVGKPRLIGAAEYGLMCCHRFDGSEVWNEKILCTVGDFCVTDNSRRMFMAGFAHGVRYFDGNGRFEGSYVVEGSPSRVASAFFGERLVVATAERHLYWLDADGSLLWAAETPDVVFSLICDPLGEWLILGFSGGRILKLDWEIERRA